MSIADAYFNTLGNTLWDLQDKIDRELEKLLDEHDCKKSPDSGCQVCEEYYKLKNK